jgi:hypothetical protein
MTAGAGRRMPPKDAIRKMVSFTPRLWQAIDDLRFTLRIKTDQDILMRLIRRGLEAEGVAAPDEDGEPPAAPQRRGARGRRS